MTLIRCTCGQTLGKVNGKYDFICHKCGRPIRGTTDKPVKISHGPLGKK